MVYPKTYQPENIPKSVQTLVVKVLPRLFDGDHPALVALREQSRCATIRTVELSGVGFFAPLVVPSEAPIAYPLRIVGGDAEIVLSGVEHGAGCVLFVKDGRLSLFEGYTNAGEEWSEDAEVLSIGRVTPIMPL